MAPTPTTPAATGTTGNPPPPGAEPAARGAGICPSILPPVVTSGVIPGVKYSGGGVWGHPGG